MPLVYESQPLLPHLKRKRINWSIKILKLNKQHFELFKKYCREYQEKFHLMGWDVHFEFIELKGKRAETAFNLESSQATIALCADWQDQVMLFNKKNLKLTAKHEMLHLFLGRMGELAQYRYVQRRELDAAEHEIIQKLEKLLP